MDPKVDDLSFEKSFSHLADDLDRLVRSGVEVDGIRPLRRVQHVEHLTRIRGATEMKTKTTKTTQEKSRQ